MHAAQAALDDDTITDDIDQHDHDDTSVRCVTVHFAEPDHNEVHTALDGTRHSVPLVLELDSGAGTCIVLKPAAFNRVRHLVSKKLPQSTLDTGGGRQTYDQQYLLHRT